MSARYPAECPVFRGPHGDVVGRPLVRRGDEADTAKIGDTVDLSPYGTIVVDFSPEWGWTTVIDSEYRPRNRAARELLAWSRQ